MNLGPFKQTFLVAGFSFGLDCGPLNNSESCWIIVHLLTRDTEGCNTIICSHRAAVHGGGL